MVHSHENIADDMVNEWVGNQGRLVFKIIPRRMEQMVTRKITNQDVTQICGEATDSSDFLIADLTGRISVDESCLRGSVSDYHGFNCGTYL